MTAQKHVTRAPAPSFEGFEELEAMIGEGLAAKREKEAAQKARERLVRGGLPPDEVAADAALLREWEEKHEYRNTAQCAIFVEQECEGCGDCQYFLQGVFVRQEHRVLSGVRRWLPSTNVADDSLPREILRQERSVPFCGQCCEGRGFAWARSYFEGDDPTKLIDGDGSVFIEPGVLETPWPFSTQQVGEAV